MAAVIAAGLLAGDFQRADEHPLNASAPVNSPPVFSNSPGRR